MKLDDGSYTIFLSTKGENEEATKENILELIAAKAHSLCAFEEEAEKYLQSKAEKI